MSNLMQYIVHHLNKVELNMDPKNIHNIYLDIPVDIDMKHQYYW